MTAYPYVLSDSATMLRRNLRHMRRYPSPMAATAWANVVIAPDGVRGSTSFTSSPTRCSSRPTRPRC
jgi:hypothetical protein